MRVLADTSVLAIIDRLRDVPPQWQWTLSSLSYAELSWGVQRAQGDKRARRQAHVDLIRASLGAGLPFDDACAGRYGYLCEVTERQGRRPRGRVLDLMIAAVAMQHEAALATANPGDVAHLGAHLEIVAFTSSGARLA